MQRHPFHIIALKLLIEEDASKYCNVEEATINTVEKYILGSKETYGEDNNRISAVTFAERARKFWSYDPFLIEDKPRNKKAPWVYVSDDTMDLLCSLLKTSATVRSWKEFEEAISQHPLSKVAQNFMNKDGKVNEEDRRYLEKAAQVVLFFTICETRVSGAKPDGTDEEVETYLGQSLQLESEEERKIAAMLMTRLAKPIELRKYYLAKVVKKRGPLAWLKRLWYRLKPHKVVDGVKDADYQEVL